MYCIFLSLLISIQSVLGRDVVKTCPSGESCVAFSHCRKWCQKAENGQIGRDLAVRRDLKSSTCNFIGFLPYLCCPQSSISQQKLCLFDPQDRQPAPSGYPEPRRIIRPTNDRKSDAASHQCGQVQREQGLRCVGCNSTSPGDWPWMARLLYKNRDIAETSCGGVLVSSRHVITAAHCVVLGQVPDMVALGDSDISTEFDCLDGENGCQVAGRRCFRSGVCAPRHVEVPVRAVSKHPNFEYCQDCVPDNDIAVIVLDDLVRFSTFIQPVCLSALPDEKAPHGPLVMTGWGNTQGGLSSPVPARVLQQLVLEVVDLQKCGEIWKTKLLSSQICASSGTAGQAPCQGDSGGPLVRQVDRVKEIWELVGVVSFGPGMCGNADHPVVFTRIFGQLLEWVRGVVGRYEVKRA